ncbi:hypothetical protein HDU67_010025 [Dinochytrium kinnereticum]|nr:hypothetical protein HDU67_010025 [Dinochytrium kinnereticum]
MLFSALVAVALAASANAQAGTLLEVLSSQTGEFNVSTLLGAVTAQPEIATTLTSITGNLTVFAPVNSAFAKLPAAALSNSTVVADILSYHASLDTYAPTAAGTTYIKTVRPNPKNFDAPTELVATLAGSNVTLSYGLGKANVLKSETFNNGAGVVHFISDVLLPPTSISATASAANLTGIVGALTAVGGVAGIDALQGVTVFVPTNAAFEAIASTIATLTPVQITGVLAYHVIPAVLKAGDVVAALTAGNFNIKVPSYLQQDVTVASDSALTNITAAGPGNTVPARITVTDILVDSGVIHLIDAVLIPEVGQIGTPTLTQIAPVPKTTTALNTATVKPTSPAGATTAATSSKPSSAGVAGVSVAALFASAVVAVFAF